MTKEKPDMPLYPQWPASIRDRLHLLRQALQELYVVQVFAILFTLLSVTSSIIDALVLSNRIVAMFKICFSLLAALLLTTIGILINTKVYKEVQGIDVAGQNIGISASFGTPFLALTCTTSVLMSLVNILYLRELYCSYF